MAYGELDNFEGVPQEQQQQGYDGNSSGEDSGDNVRVDSDSDDNTTDYKSEVVRLRDELGRFKTRATDWDNWYATHIMPHYKDSKEFHKAVTSWLSNPQAQQQVSQQAQQQVYQQQPNIQQAANERYNEAIQQQYYEAAQEGRNYLTREEVQQALQQRDAYYNNVLSQVYNKAVQDAITKMNSEILPEYFELYDKVSDIRNGKLAGDKGKFGKLIKHMVTNKVKDPESAYKDVFGEEELQKRIAEARAEGAREAELKLREDQGRKAVNVLGTNGVFPQNNAKGTKRGTIQDGLNKTLQEVVGKYGPGVLNGIN